MINRNDNQRLNESHTRCISSSSDDDSDIEDESKIDSNIPDDEKYFIHTDTETNEVIEPNNMMDIFRRQSSNPNEICYDKNQATDCDTILEKDLFQNSQQANESQHNLFAQILSIVHTDESQNGKTLTLIEQQTNNTNNDDRSLHDNFSFLIAKGMLKPPSSR